MPNYSQLHTELVLAAMRVHAGTDDDFEAGADPGKLQGKGHESKWCTLPIPKIKNSSDFGHLILVVPHFQFFF